MKENLSAITDELIIMYEKRWKEVMSTQHATVSKFIIADFYELSTRT